MMRTRPKESTGSGPEAATPAAHGARAATGPVLFELRNYVTRAGRRDELVDLFERHFLDAYEAAGARVTGTFTHSNDPDRWIWIRAFADNESRGTALDGFYTSAAWLARRAAANRTIEDISDALLLRLRTGSLAALQAPGHDASRPVSVVECLRWFPRPGQPSGFADPVMAEAIPVLVQSGAEVVAVLESVALPNAYPRLPLREDAAVVVLARHPDQATYAAHRAARDRSVDWRRAIDRLGPLSGRPPEIWPLGPTARSALR